MLRLAKIAALVSVVVLLNAVTTLLFVQTRVPAGAQVGPSPCVTGDVNGDSILDVADPVYLLTHLFGMGPAPQACAQTSPATMLFAYGATNATGVPGDTQYAVFHVQNQQILPGENAVAIPRGGLLRNLRVTKNCSAICGDFAVSVVVNGMETSLTANTTNSPTSAPGISIPVSAGDTLCFKFSSTDTTQGSGIAVCELE